MAGEDDEIVVTIEDSGGDDGGVVLVDDTGITTGTVVKKGSDDPVATLKSQLAEKQSALDASTQRTASAEAAATQATQRAAQAEREADAAIKRVGESEKTTITTGIAAAKAEADAAEEAYKVAFEAGDAGGVAKAQRRISGAVADLKMLEQSAADIAEAPPQKRAVTPANPTQAADPVEQFIRGRTPPTQQWLRAHMEYLTDPKKNAKMQAAHYDAESEGLTLDSPQYFDHVERFLGMKKADTQQNGSGHQPSQRRPTAPSAPVSDTGGGVSGNGRTVTLTRGEAAAATDGTHIFNYDDPTGKNRWKKGDPIGLQEMARRKQALQKDGRYHNANVDGT